MMLAYYLKKFGLAYAILLPLIALISYALKALFSINLGQAASLGMIIGATIYAAQSYAIRENQTPEKSFSWKFAVFSFLTALVISAVWLIVIAQSISMFAGINIFSGISAIPLKFFALGFLFIGALNILFIRFLFPMFVKNSLKSQSIR